MVQRFAELLHAVPREGKPTQLRFELMRLLGRLGFREQIVEPTRTSNDDQELPQVMLNLNALESIRRALVAAHGGSIGIDTRRGAGTCVWFTLPSAACQAADDTDLNARPAG